MMSSHAQKSEYQAFLEHQFSTIFTDCNDNTATSPLSPDIINRQEILYMQFQMEKKGKNFGISEWRLLKIEADRLFQVDKNQEEKMIPTPNSIVICRKVDDSEEWEEKYAQFQAKIVMRFTGRTDITVFFRSVIECNEIAMFLTSKIRQEAKRNFDAVAGLFKQRVVSEVVKKIQMSREEVKGFKNGKIKAKLNEHFRKNMNDRTCVASLLEFWKSKALFPKQRFTFSLALKQLDFKAQNYAGVMKIWVRGIVRKQFSINKQNTGLELFDSHKSIKFDQSFTEQMTDIASEDQLQIQLDVNGAIWSSQRFNANDLKKISLTHPKIQLHLANNGELAYLNLEVSFHNSQTIAFNQTISPKHYRVIDQLYKKNQQRYQLAKIHQHYSQILQSQRKSTFYYTSFNKLKQLIALLKLQQLIQKFYSVQPFNAYINTEFKATFIYEYFLRNYEKQLYYEIQKLMWRYQEKTYKRILTALKVFDQNPKFNFTDSFFYLVKRMHEIASRESSNRWKDGLFSKNLKGVESIAFFLSIGVIKTFSSIFIHQEFVNKRALPYNSLLFIYTLRKALPSVYNKLNILQLNIQAYFGCHLVSLFCKLFQGEMFSRILTLLLSQKKEDAQTIYIHTLIAVFLTVVSIIDSLKCSYASAEHYIITFEEYCKNVNDKFAFFPEVQKWKTITKEYSIQREYDTLSNDMTEFYLNNAYSGELGEISKQIYQQFTCYHYKNQTDLRKILIFIDKISIGSEQDTQNITLSIFQSASKLYQHQFKGINLSQIGHFIEIKLIKLEELTIICNTSNNSYSCRLDPKEVSSNLYFHFVKPLILTYHLSPELNRHIFFQAYIKDNCEIDTLENPIPIKYREMMLDRDLTKQDILFCKKFNKTFRMRENNFNLLYSKLGWFGNHYLIPDQRLIGIEIMGFRNGGKEELHSRIALMNRSTRAIYGKALAPYPSSESRKLSVEIIKQGIHTDYEPYSSLKTSLNEANTYNSASRLLCYQLDNFCIPTYMQFLEFYYQMNEKLPLIRYLSYHPKLFYLLPTFTLQVSTYNSVCTIIISQKGISFITQFTSQQVQEIEEKAAEYNRLPQEIEFSYTDKDMYFDDFLVLLRLNILKRIIALDKKDKKLTKAKRWPNSLNSTSVLIPNYKLHHFYEVMNETKQIIQLQFKQLKRLRQKIEYKDYGLVGNRWIKVYCISLLKTSQQLYYYVLSEFQRKKYILKETDFIMVDQSEQKKTVSLSDDIANSMQIITYQLNQLFEL